MLTVEEGDSPGHDAQGADGGADRVGEGVRERHVGLGVEDLDQGAGEVVDVVVDADAGVGAGGAVEDDDGVGADADAVLAGGAVAG